MISSSFILQYFSQNDNILKRDKFFIIKSLFYDYLEFKEKTGRKALLKIMDFTENTVNGKLFLLKICLLNFRHYSTKEDEGIL